MQISEMHEMGMVKKQNIPVNWHLLWDSLAENRISPLTMIISLKAVNYFHRKISIVDVRLGSKYASAIFLNSIH